jgi:hypothetical protein
MTMFVRFTPSMFTTAVGGLVEMTMTFGIGEKDYYVWACM